MDTAAVGEREGGRRRRPTVTLSLVASALSIEASVLSDDPIEASGVASALCELAPISCELVASSSISAYGLRW